MDVKFLVLEPENRDKLILFINKILKEGNSHNVDIYNKEYWEWQYCNLPTKKSYVYVAELNNEIIGYYHVPVYNARYENRMILLAGVQDVAIDKNFRGSGLFKRLSEFAEHHLNSTGIDIIYTFPNEKSIHTFLKYNKYSYIKTLNTYILISDASNIISERLNFPYLNKLLALIVNFYAKFLNINKEVKVEISAHNEFTNEIEDVFLRHDRRFKVSLLRNMEYLNWRYVSKPGVKHYILSLKRNGLVKGVAIFKVDTIFQSRALILMDFAYVEKVENLIYLIQSIKKSDNEIIKESFQLILAGGNDSAFKKFYKTGFIKIPHGLNPRKLNLLVKALAPKVNINRPERWRITFSDWDVL